MRQPTLLVLAVTMSAMLFASARPMAGGMDGVIMRDGKMMTMKAGKAIDPMTANATMSNGTVVTPDGLVKMPNGHQEQLKDGQMMMMDGTIMEGGNPKPMMKPRGMNAGE
jgi:hypothetical protein